MLAKIIQQLWQFPVTPYLAVYREVCIGHGGDCHIRWLVLRRRVWGIVVFLWDMSGWLLYAWKKMKENVVKSSGVCVSKRWLVVLIVRNSLPFHAGECCWVCIFVLLFFFFLLKIRSFAGICSCVPHCRDVNNSCIWSCSKTLCMHSWYSISYQDSKGSRVIVKEIVLD